MNETYPNGALNGMLNPLTLAIMQSVGGGNGGTDPDALHGVSVNGTPAPVENKIAQVTAITEADVLAIVEEELAGFTKLEIRRVEELPQTGETGVFYLVPNSDEQPNSYDEYIWVTTLERFELLGPRTVDLSGYVEKTQKVGGVPLSGDVPISLTGDSAISVTDTGTASAVGFSVTHNDSGVTAGSKGDTTNQTPGFGGTFKAVSATVDAKGHVTALGDHTVTVPSATATSSANGLMSSTDKAKLDSISLPPGGVSMPVILANQSIATFDSAAAGRPIRVTAHIQPVQADGTPSPSNPLPISGWTGVNVTVSPNAQGTGGTAYTVAFPASIGTVYGGALDVARGLLTVTHNIVTLNGSQAIIKSSSRPNTFFIRISDAVNVTDENQLIESSVSSEIAPSTTWTNIESVTLGCAPLYGKGIAFRDAGKLSTQDWTDYFTAHPTKFIYRLSEHVTYQLTPQQLVTLDGTNNVSADCGPVTVTHWPGTGTPVEPVEGGDITTLSMLIKRIEDLEAAIIEGGS